MGRLFVASLRTSEVHRVPFFVHVFSVVVPNAELLFLSTLLFEIPRKLQANRFPVLSEATNAIKVATRIFARVYLNRFNFKRPQFRY